MLRRKSNGAGYPAFSTAVLSARGALLAAAAVLAFGLGSAAAWAAPQCSDGIDNDHDQTIDALVEGSADQSVEQFANHAPWGVYTEVENELRANRQPSPRDLLGKDKGGMAFVNDALTASKVCRILGYTNVVYVGAYDHEGKTIWANGDDTMYNWTGAQWRRTDDQTRYRNPNHWSWIADITCQGRLPACRDGKDNDGDGRIDYPQDAGCASANDLSEQVHDADCSDPSDPSEAPAPVTACSNGRDDDHDGYIDSADDGCIRSGGVSECHASLSECDNCKDDDGDGLVDMADPQCTVPWGASEAAPAPKPHCSDGIDNDGDRLVDYPADPGCSSKDDTWERNAAGPQCDNGSDDDGDGKIDFPHDPDCTDARDAAEGAPAPLPQCSDGIDNDGDRLADYPADPGCSSKADTWERNAAGPQCDNGSDDDGDGKSDFPADPDCTGPTDGSERPETASVCTNGLDDDRDGYCDSADDGCIASGGQSECHASLTQCDNCKDDDGDGKVDMADPGCSAPWGTSEGSSPPPCPACHQTACNNGKDDDLDGYVDNADDGCIRSGGTTECHASLTQCDNCKDDDGDGLVDMADAGCLFPWDETEAGCVKTCLAPAYLDRRTDSSDHVLHLELSANRIFAEVTALVDEFRQGGADSPAAVAVERKASRLRSRALSAIGKASLWPQSAAECAEVRARVSQYVRSLNGMYRALRKLAARGAGGRERLSAAAQHRAHALLLAEAVRTEGSCQ